MIATEAAGANPNSEWETCAAQVDLLALTLAEMRALHARCPDPLGSAAAKRLWRLIVAMVHTGRGPDQRPSPRTVEVFEDGTTREPVH